MSRLQGSDWIATVFKIGTLPFAPGTWGSLVALIGWYWIIDWLSPTIFFALIVVIFVVGVITSTIVESEMKTNDPSRVVIDEWVGQWIALFLLPKSVPYGLVAFVLFRIFDIWKPWPIRTLDELPKGWGIMLDDVGAGFVTFLLIQGYRLAVV